MARTAITTSPLVKDGSLADPAGLTITSGVVTAGTTVTGVNGQGASVANPAKMLLRVTNSSASAVSVIVRGSGYTGAPNGAANSGIPAPQNTVYTQSTVGDLTVSVAASGTVWLGPFTGDRFIQPDGSLSVDFGTGFTGAITAFQMPYVVPS